MIVLDTNVVSELMRRDPDPSVLAWADRFPANQVFLTAVTAAELRHGVARLPDGGRKALLAARLCEVLDTDFGDQVLAFTAEAAQWYAEIVAARENMGRPISVADAQIAAICRLYSFGLLTRNVKDFADTGVHVFDPWVPPAVHGEV